MSSQDMHSAKVPHRDHETELTISRQLHGFTIDAGIPIPTRAGSLDPIVDVMKSLNVGESFFVPTDGQYKSTMSVAGRVNRARYHVNVEHPSRSFMTRRFHADGGKITHSLNEGVRVWRVKDGTNKKKHKVATAVAATDNGDA